MSQHRRRLSRAPQPPPNVADHSPSHGGDSGSGRIAGCFRGALLNGFEAASPCQRQAPRAWGGSAIGGQQSEAAVATAKAGSGRHTLRVGGCETSLRHVQPPESNRLLDESICQVPRDLPSVELPYLSPVAVRIPKEFFAIAAAPAPRRLLPQTPARPGAWPSCVAFLR